MIGGGSVFKNTKVKKPKFKKKSEGLDQIDQYELHGKSKHHDKAMYRMLKTERYEDVEY